LNTTLDILPKPSIIPKKLTFPGTLLIQAPGSFLFVYSLAIQPGTNWTSWISFAFSGTFQFMLILMYIVFERKDEVGGEERERLLGEDVVEDLIDVVENVVDIVENVVDVVEDVACT
jgi:hypothetical protein